MRTRNWLMCVAGGLGVSPLALGDEFNNLADYLAATTSNNLIDFDTLPNGDDAPESGDIFDDYIDFGVVFPAGNFYSQLSGPVSGTHGWINNKLSDDGFTRIFDADIVDDNVTAVGVWQALFCGGGGTTLFAYDADGNVLATAQGDNDPNTIDFFGLTTDSPIASIEIRWTNWLGWALDDLYVGEAVGGECYADCNGDGQLNILDFVCFQGAFQRDCD